MWKITTDNPSWKGFLHSDGKIYKEYHVAKCDDIRKSKCAYVYDKSTHQLQGIRMGSNIILI